MISATNMPPPEGYFNTANKSNKPTTVLLLPSFQVIEDVAPKDVPELLEHFVLPGPTTSTPLRPQCSVAANGTGATSGTTTTGTTNGTANGTTTTGDSEVPTPKTTNGTTTTSTLTTTIATASIPSIPTYQPKLPRTLTSHPSPHSTILLLCSHHRRDARCGISAPLLAREFERVLRPLGLYRDHNDMRPGGVGIYFISHVGGHKYAANLLVYRKEDGMGVWLGRVTPKDVEGIVKMTVLKGKVVEKDMIRGGFYRKEGLVSW